MPASFALDVVFLVVVVHLRDFATRFFMVDVVRLPTHGHGTDFWYCHYDVWSTPGTIKRAGNRASWSNRVWSDGLITSSTGDSKRGITFRLPYEHINGGQVQGFYALTSERRGGAILVSIPLAICRTPSTPRTSSPTRTAAAHPLTRDTAAA